MELFFFGVTDVGKVREKNEDSFITKKLGPREYLFIVADGMGGHNAGEVASRMAVTNFVKELKKVADTISITNLNEIVQTLNNQINKKGNRWINTAGMGTTLSALYIKDSLGYIAHVGDSRIYRYSHGRLEQLTDDHSAVGKLLKDGLISSQEAMVHPQRNILYQSLGMRGKLEVQLRGPFEISSTDKFLLCSDGLTNQVADDEIAMELKIKSTEAISKTLLNRVLCKGAMDNVTIITVSGEEDQPVEMESDDCREILRSQTTTRSFTKEINLWIILSVLVFLVMILSYLIITEVLQSPIQ
jgi:protein phosphatase